MAHAARTDIGFQGGQVLSLRAADDAFEALTKALADDGAPRWYTVELEDETLRLDLSQVVYIRRATGDRTVGF